MITRKELLEKSEAFEKASLKEILVWAWEALGSRVAFGTAFGSSGMVLLDVMQKVAPHIPVFTIDTDFLFPETLNLIDQVETRYNIKIERVFSRLSLEEQEHDYGPELYDSDSDRCCWLRKVEPLQRKLSTLNGWMNSRRRDQGETRRRIPILEYYETDGRALLKLNPMATWTRKQVWDYILEHDVPYNPLMDQGYASIGCWPCTKAMGADADERAGRWAGSGKVECGIHTFLQPVEPVSNVVESNEPVQS
ncbi:MAG: phosphoadenylyl-sulfate reductase [Candidatus Latescibacteria bacterium]|nr:phosphoadenylyl-sulfate reductase [Candidatus Latescibacterota bacterium]